MKQTDPSKNTHKVSQQSRQRLADGLDSSFLRSGAVARMLRMPVATLRIWERRYGLTESALSPGGQRLYSAEDVRRLTLLKQLTGLGHAIGSLAGLSMAQLQRVASTRAQALAATQPTEQKPAAPESPIRAWRVVVIGDALAIRLKRPSLLRRLGRPLNLLGPFDSAAQAAAALSPSDVDALLVHEPHLQAGWLKSFLASAPSWARVPRAVLYSFAADTACEALAEAGTALLREPQPDVVVAQWLHALSNAEFRHRSAAYDGPILAKPVSPRRWDDTALAEFARLSSTIACECPRHLADLLMQLAHFEAYSSECEHRNAADAEIHDYLKRVAAAARSQFEQTLEHVALHEGLMLPFSPMQAIQRRPR